MIEEERKNSARKQNPQYKLCPALQDEAGLFYALSPEEDKALGTIGHLRIDFGHHGHEWWSTWHPRSNPTLNTPEFRAELDELVNELRKDGGVLHSLEDMKRYCQAHGGDIEGGWSPNYGFTVNTDRYLFRIRCNPSPGDYQCYLTCFDKSQQCQMDKAPLVGRLLFADGSVLNYQNNDEFISAINEELPFHSVTGVKIQIIAKDPKLKKDVADHIYDFYGEENPHPIEDYISSEYDTPEMSL